MLRLRTFSGYDSLTAVQRRGICNGAGAAGVWYSRFIPNTIYGLDCTIVFDIHDHGYWAGRTPEDRASTDMDMLVNLIIVINRQSGLLARPRRCRAMKYYEAVHLHGSAAYCADKPHFSRRMVGL